MNQVKKEKGKTVSDVWLYIPNLLDYLRLILVLVGFVLGNYYQYYFLNSLFYVFSHFLDMIDGPAARYFNQCSNFGVVLDYTIDIVTEMIWFLQLSPLVGLNWRTLMVLAIVIDVFGLVFSIYNSARGSYWKGTKYRPTWQEPFINDRGYTRLGYQIVLWYQIFWATFYLSYFYYIPSIIVCTLAIPMLLELASLTMILYEQILLFSE